MSDLYRLVYTSFRKRTCTEEEVKNILASCEKNNPERQITGILLHAKNRFIQYMEGSKSSVQALYDLIKEDPRHTSVNLRSFEPIEERVFPSWEMGYKDLEDQELKFQTSVSDVDQKKFEALINADLDFDNDGMRILQLFFKS